jgi:hypothetical protein
MSVEDVTLTQLFSRMDAHLAQQDAHLERQDAHLAVITETLSQQNAVLAEMAQLLATTARQVTEAHAETMRGFAGLTTLLDTRLRRAGGGAP